LEKEKTGIYDLDNSYYLYQDIEDILDSISNIYEIKFGVKSTEYESKIILSNEHHWTSNESAGTFNKLVPKIKSITKDMYSIIEGIYTSKRGEFKKIELEKEYKNLKEFRILNNKLKHHNDREAKITLTELSMLTEKGSLIDCYLQFRYIKSDKFEALRFTDLINVFFKILEDEKIITISRE
jgi:hypothetical protein|tara:strand:+ start:66 stop:611 length:546 start_codon:yes stop_codon:yes gene_type:complete